MRLRLPRVLAIATGTVLATAAIPPPVSAQVSVATTSPSSKDEALQTTAAVAALAAATWGASLLDAKTCRWCDRSAGGAPTLNGFDRSLREALVASRVGAADRANTIGTVTEVTTWIVPMVQVASSRNDVWTNHDRWESVRMVTWAMAANTIATGVLKRAVARERPYVHFKNQDVRSKAEPNASFPSGHTSSSFTSVFAAASACRRLSCGHDKSIWLVGVPLASVTGVLRIRADKHYATDVLAGFGIGAAIGWFIPQLYDAVTNDDAPATAQPAKSRLTWGFSRTWVW
jgi:membrane-associated phospholipid phosphatase